jgi:hypothetical protein
MKIVMIVCLMVLCALSTTAQIQFGVKAGANISTLTGSDASGSKTKIGFQGSVLLAVPVGDGFWVQPEVNYSMQGAKGTVNFTDFTLSQNYLNVPVLFKYIHPSGVFAETGPQIGFLMSANVSAGGSSTDVKAAYQSVDYGWAFGVGYLIKAINAGIDARYNLGFINIEANTGNNYSNGTTKSSVFQFGIFVMFGGDKSGNRE